MASAPVIPQFFVPQQEPGSLAEERQYERMRDAVGADSSREPRKRRIFSVGCRVAGKDCVVEVGRPDPVEGSEVLAIFNIRGEDEPFLVCTAGGSRHPALRLGRHVYAVTEFS